MARRKPLAKPAFPDMQPIEGVSFATAACGVAYKGRTDLLLAELRKGTQIAGVFTRSLTASAPVKWCREILPGGKARAIVVNAGNANAFTGRAGDDIVRATAKRAAEVIGCRDKEVFVASTGVIGQTFSPKLIPGKLAGLHRRVKPDVWTEAAAAIMTTDSVPKGVVRTARIGDATVTINGIGKGTQMIHPDMATTLNFVFTDAKIPAAVLQKALTHAADRSFNCITIEGDTSTSDSLFLCATGAARHPRITGHRDPALKDFCRALEEVCIGLSQAIVRDAEGASRFVTLHVTGAASMRAARTIGRTIASATLFKVSMAEVLPPWGRMIMAVGKSGEKADRDRLDIDVGGMPVAREGAVLGGYDAAGVEAHLKGSEIELSIDVGVGRGKATVWTSDRGKGYG
ncbi:MAG: bifunctional glutamate N-acetyltransferase/amino-acid acetyltransferase ArgJ [Alphaproteobacteria bacterium]|nr:bifunctional glutamate N-acetyltransferase/amino-acid acetyltransferase ArgJ [Alphaproteobacteria bacterium]